MEVEEERLRQVEAEFEAHRKQVEAARKAFQKTKYDTIERQRVEMSTKLIDLDAQIAASRVTRQALRKKLLEKKVEAHEHIVQQEQLQKDAWIIQRSHELEEVARKRICLENIQKQHKHLDELSNKTCLQLQAIDAERQKRRIEKENQIEHLITKGSMLEKQFQNDTIIEKISDIDAMGNVDFIHFSNECQGQLRIEQEKSLNHRHKELMQLNAERKKLLEQEEELRRKKQEFDYISTKGIDYLVEMEFGQAPPLEFIIKNMPNEPPLVDFPDDSNEDILVQATRWLESGENTLAELEKAIPEVNKPQICLTEPLQRPNTPIHNLCENLVDEIIRLAMDAIPVPKSKAELKQEDRLWRTTKLNLIRVMRRENRKQVPIQVRNQLLDEVVNEILHHVLNEFLDTKKCIEDVWFKSCFAIICPNSPPVYESLLKNALHQLNLHRTANDVHQGTILNELSQTLKASAPQKEEPKQVVPLNVKLPKEINVSAIIFENPNATLVAVQLAYWKHITHDPLDTKSTSRISIDSVFLHDKYVYMTGPKGEIYIYNIETAKIIREQKASQSGITMLHATSAYGSFISVNKKGQATLSISSDSIQPIVQVTKDDLTRPRYAVDDIVCGHILPCYTIIGMPMSFLVGTKDGTIARLNRGVGVGQPVCGISIATTEPLAVLEIDKAKQHTMSIDIPPKSIYPKREFFHGHNAAICFLDHIGLDIVSADVSGVVCFWKYDILNFSGFGWWNPTSTINLNSFIHCAALSIEDNKLIVLTGLNETTKKSSQCQVLQLELPILNICDIELKLPLLRPPFEFALVPRVEGLPGDNIVVCYENILFIYSLATGKAVISIPLKSPMTSLSATDTYIAGIVCGKLSIFRLNDKTPGDVLLTSLQHTKVHPGKNMIQRELVKLSKMKTNEPNDEELVLTWSNPPMDGFPPSARGGQSMLLAGQQLVLFGGHYFGGEGGFVYLNEVWVLDLETSTWSQIKCEGKSPAPRYNHSATLVGSKMFIFGGKGDKGKVFRDMHYLDLENWHWFVVNWTTESPSERFGHADLAVGTKLVISGGWDGQSKTFKDLWVFDTETFAWIKPKVGGNPPTARHGHKMCLLDNGHIVLYGGQVVKTHPEVSVEYFNDVYTMDTETMSWMRPRVTGDIPVATFGHSMTLVDRKVYIIGGWSGTERSPIYMGDKAMRQTAKALAREERLQSGYDAQCMDYRRMLGVSKYVHVLDCDEMVWWQPISEGCLVANRYGHSTSLVGNHIFAFGGWDGNRSMNELVVADLSTTIS
ncbi:hypothetical protein THRCLA_10088 [Thraustotheca clavata]|uniref:Uncharacterized protein n=1 Tax=Thraustotheca clavata TaxID=74557 RepID=A0A1V9YSV3_9STRA|nr:hypothetical protein THRCLA_10088 [Thraustotheca clavata]